MKAISFNWNTNYLICPIIMGISFGIRYTFTCLCNENIHFLIFSLIMFIGQFSSFIFEIILKSRFKNNKRDEIQTFVTTNKSSCSIRWDFVLIFCASFLDFISFSILGAIKLIGSIHDESIDSLSFTLRMTQTLFLSGLSIVFLNIQLYKHNILGIIIIFLGITALVIMNMHSDSWLVFGVNLISYFLNSFRIIIMKVLLDKWYYSTYKLLFIIGSIGIALMIFIMPFTLLIKSEIFSFQSIFIDSFKVFKDEPISILYIIVIYLMGFVFNVSGTLANHRLSSTHVGIGDTLAGLILIVIFKRNDILFLLLSFCVNLIILIACMIYTEVISFDCCGLQRNINNEIYLRGIEEKIEVEEILKN